MRCNATRQIRTNFEPHCDTIIIAFYRTSGLRPCENSRCLCETLRSKIFYWWKVFKTTKIENSKSMIKKK